MSTRLGETKENNFGTLMKIVEYNRCLDITVEFQDEYKTKVHTTYSNFNKGSVKNPYDKSVYGVGYIGIGKYNVAKNESDDWKTRYSAWRNLIGRVYSEKTGYRHIPYIGCEVCKEWHNYQNFAEWYETHMYQVGTERMHIDKDIIVEGNKIYSPETCIIVPQSINEIFHTDLRKTKDLDLPYTIRRAANNRYSVTYRAKSLGIYDTVEECVDAYMKAKREHIKNKVNELKDELPEYIQDILLNW